MKIARPIRPFLWTALAFLGPLGATSFEVTSLAGGGTEEANEVPATSARLHEPFSASLAPDGSIYVAEITGRITRIDPSGRIRTLLPEGGSNGGGPLTGPHDLLVTRKGELLIADTFRNRVVRWTGTGTNLEPVAGRLAKGFSGDGGKAVDALFNGVFSLDLDADQKRLLLCDLGNRRIREVDLSTGLVKTVAGNGAKGVPTNGDPALQGPLNDPRAACYDSEGRVIIVERGGHAVRRVEKDGSILSLAGKGAKGFTNGATAMESRWNGPKHACAWGTKLLVADTENHVIRVIDPQAGTVETFLGTGKAGPRLDADPLRCELNRPHGVNVGSDGRVYVSDSLNHRVLKMTPR